MEAQESKTVIERALVSYSGTTTGDGVGGGTTVVCSALTGLPDYDGLTIIITEGAYAGLSRDINGATTGGTINVEPAFPGQIVSGINFSILTGMPAYSELVDIMGAGFDTDTDSLVKLHDDHITEITAARLGELDAANIPADIDSLLALAAMHQGLAIKGTIASIPAANQFIVTAFIGLGAGKFAGATLPWQVYVLRDQAGGSAAPQGEMQPVTAFNSATGQVNHSAFTVALTADDEIIMLHPSVAHIDFSATEKTSINIEVDNALDTAIPGSPTADSINERIKALDLGLGNETGDISAVAQSDSATIAAYLRQFKEHFRAHDQTRICLIVPNLAGLASDLPNTAIKAELDKVGTVTVLDEAGVDGGQEDWGVYDLIVVGSDSYDGGFTNTNLDDLVTVKVPVMVCNSAVADHLKMGTDTTQSASTVNEWCKSIYNRVMYRVFGATGDQEIFSEAAVSDRLNMSDASLTELLLMTSLTGDDESTAVVGWLPMETPVGVVNTLDDDTELPAGRLFAGCFVNADKLTELGQELLRSLVRNFTEASITPSITLKAAAQTVAAIHNDTNELQTDWTDGGRLDLLIDAINADADPKVMGRSQIFEKSITSAANAGDVNVATITDHPCLIEEVIIHADTAQTGDLTSCGVFGGTNKVITFIAAADALQADLDAEDKQVAWMGAVRLAATKTIVISLVGGAATAVDLTIVIKYRACVSGGYLA